MQAGSPPPVEHRLMGFDRRYLWPAGIVFFVALFWSVIVPAIDEAITAKAIPEGTVYTLAHNVTFSPAAGWTVDEAPSPAQSQIAVFREGVVFEVSPGTWEGTAEELLKQIEGLETNVRFEGSAFSVQTGEGVQGVAVPFFEHNQNGTLYAFVSGGIGVSAAAKGPADSLRQRQADVDRMVESIRFNQGRGQ